MTTHIYTPEQSAKNAETRKDANKALVAHAFKLLGIGEPEWKTDRWNGIYCRAASPKLPEEVCIDLGYSGNYVRIEYMNGYGTSFIEYDDAKKLATSIRGRWKRQHAAAVAHADKLDKDRIAEARDKELRETCAATLNKRLGSEAAHMSTTVDIRNRVGASGAVVVFAEVSVFMHREKSDGTHARLTSKGHDAESACELVTVLHAQGWEYGLPE